MSSLRLKSTDVGRRQPIAVGLIAGVFAEPHRLRSGLSQVGCKCRLNEYRAANGVVPSQAYPLTGKPTSDERSRRALDHRSGRLV